MIDSDAQAKLDKLARIEKKNRERARRYLERVKREGKKQLSAIISGKAYDELCRRRDASILTGKPLSFGNIIEDALFLNINTNTSDNVNINAFIKQKLKPVPAKIIEDELELFENQPEPKKDQINEESKQGSVSHDMPDRSNREAYGKWLVNEINRLKDSGMSWVKITDKFNTEGIVGVSGKAFGRGAVQRFYGLEQKRLGKF